MTRHEQEQVMFCMSGWEMFHWREHLWCGVGSSGAVRWGKCVVSKHFKFIRGLLNSIYFQVHLKAVIWTVSEQFVLQNLDNALNYPASSLAISVDLSWFSISSVAVWGWAGLGWAGLGWAGLAGLGWATGHFTSVVTSIFSPDTKQHYLLLDTCILGVGLQMNRISNIADASLF